MSKVLPPLPTIDPPAPRAPVGPDRPSLAAKDSMPQTAVQPAEVETNRNVEEDVVTEVPVVSLGGFDNAREALVGVPADLLAGRGTLYDIVTRNNRLRGLGIILVFIAIFAAVFELFR